MPKRRQPRSCFNLGMNRCRCQKPLASGDGSSRGSCSPAEVLPQSRLPVDVLDLPVLRSRAAILQHGVSHLGATPAASSSQSAASGERRGSSGSSRSAACVSLPAVATPGDGSRFPTYRISSTIGWWNSDHDAGGCAARCSGARPGRCLAALHGLRTLEPLGRSFSAYIFSQVSRNDRSGSAGTDPPLFFR
jgi:hypothetical protein